MPEWIEIAVRAILFIFALFLITKLLGKKQISEISFFEYVSGITIGSIAAEVIMKLESSIFHGLIGIFVFGFVTVLVDFLSIKSKRFREIAEGKATIFMQDGKVLEENLKKEKYSLDEFNTLLRKKDVFSFADVEFAVLEPSGELSVLLKKENRPITLKDLNINASNEKETQTVIMDGKILNSSLVAAGKSLNWLYTELEKMDVTLENVFLGQINSYGELTIDLYDDKIQVPTPQERPLLMAMMKKCEADLEGFALQTESETAKKMYEKNAEKLENVIQNLTPYLNG